MEAKKVDNMFVFEPVDPKNAEGRVESPAQLPINNTHLAARLRCLRMQNLRSQNPGEGQN